MKKLQSFTVTKEELDSALGYKKRFDRPTYRLEGELVEEDCKCNPNPMYPHIDENCKTHKGKTLHELCYPKPQEEADNGKIIKGLDKKYSKDKPQPIEELIWQDSPDDYSNFWQALKNKSNEHTKAINKLNK